MAAESGKSGAALAATGVKKKSSQASNAGQRQTWRQQQQRMAAKRYANGVAVKQASNETSIAGAWQAAAARPRRGKKTVMVATRRSALMRNAIKSAIIIAKYGESNRRISACRQSMAKNEKISKIINGNGSV